MSTLSKRLKIFDPNQSEWKKRGHGFYILVKILEEPVLFFGWLFLILITTKLLFNFWDISWFHLLFAPFLILLVSIILVIVFVLKSWKHGSNRRNEKLSSLLIFNEQKFAKKWEKTKKKIPMETAIEGYINGKLDFKNNDVFKIFESRYELFRFSFTWGHIKSFLKDILGRIWKHTDKENEKDVAGVYNRGNDFYGWFLDDRMLYSSGIFQDQNDDLKDAQTRKLHKICKMLQMKRNGEHLDLGCGWGALINFASKYYDVKSTGITLSSEQAKFCKEQATKNKIENKVKVNIMDAWDIPSKKKYDTISCVEMSEHIGIKDYQKFMLHVKKLLKDDGIFYLQIAGLRRAWQYEDLVWGLFMGKYIFPGADASCPLAWVIEQVERAGFEVNVVENNGVHYSITIKRWYDNWVKNKEKVIKKYGQWWWRNWSIFLAWSHLIAAQGSSTVYMMSLTKNLANDKISRKDASGSIKPVLNRTEMHISSSTTPKKDDIQ